MTLQVEFEKEINICLLVITNCLPLLKELRFEERRTTLGINWDTDPQNYACSIVPPDKPIADYLQRLTTLTKLSICAYMRRKTLGAVVLACPNVKELTIRWTLKTIILSTVDHYNSQLECLYLEKDIEEEATPIVEFMEALKCKHPDLNIRITKVIGRWNKTSLR